MMNPYDIGPPDPPEPSELEDAVLALVEDAGMPSEVSDKIMQIISDWERARDESLIEEQHERRYDAQN